MRTKEQQLQHSLSLQRSLQGVASLALSLSALTGCGVAAEHGQTPGSAAEQQNAAAIEIAAQAEKSAIELIDNYQGYLNATERGDTDVVSPLPHDAVIIKQTIGDGGSVGTAVDAAMEDYAEKRHTEGQDVTWDPAQNGITNAASAHVKETLNITIPQPSDVVLVTIIPDADGNPATEGSIAVPIDIKRG